MRERVRADHGLVRLHRRPGQLGDQARRSGDLLGHHAALEPELVLPHVQQHHDLLERRVAGALADAVDRALDAPGTRGQRGQRVGHGEAQVVVAVHGEQRLLAAARLAHHATHQLPKLIGQAVPGGVGDVDDVGPGRDHRLHRLDQIIRVGAACIFRRVLHVLAQRPRVRDRLGAAGQNLLARHAQLAVDVHVRNGQHDVDLRVLRLFDRAPHGVDVFLHRSRQRSHRRAAYLARDAPARLEVASRRAAWCRR